MIHTHDNRYYLKDEIDIYFYDKEDVDNLLNDLFFRLVDEGVILMEHSHDDRYYTKPQIHDLGITGLTGGTGAGITGGTGGGITGGTGGGISPSQYYTKVETDRRYYTKYQIDLMIENISQLIDQNKINIDQEIDIINKKIDSLQVSVEEINPLFVSNDDSIAIIVDYSPPFGDNTIDVIFSATIEDVAGTELYVKLYNGSDLLYSWEPVELSIDDIGKVLYFTQQINLNIYDDIKLIILVSTQPEGHTVTLSNRSFELKYVKPLEGIDGIVDCQDNVANSSGTGSTGGVYAPVIYRCYNPHGCTNPTWISDLICSARLDNDLVDHIFGAKCPICDSYIDRKCIRYVVGYENLASIHCNLCSYEWTINTSDFWNYFKTDINSLKCPNCNSHYSDIELGIDDNIGRSVISNVDGLLSTWTISHNLNSYPVISCYDDTTSFIPKNITYLDNNVSSVTFDEPVSGYCKCTVGRVLIFPVNLSNTILSIYHELNTMFVDYICIDSNNSVVIPTDLRDQTLSGFNLEFEYPFYGKIIVAPKNDIDYGEQYGIIGLSNKIKIIQKSYTGASGGTGGAIWEIKIPDGKIYSISTQSYQNTSHPLSSYVFPGLRDEINLQYVTSENAHFFDNSIATGLTGGTGLRPRNIPNLYYEDFGQYSGVDINIPFTGGVGGTGGTMKYNYSGLCSSYSYKYMIQNPSTVWNITHNLNSYEVIPICFDMNGNQIFHASVSYPTLTTMVLTFNIPHSGIFYGFKDMINHMSYMECNIPNIEGAEGYTHLPDIYYCPDCGNIFKHSIDVCIRNWIDKYGCPNCSSANYHIIRNAFGLEMFAGVGLSGPYDTRVFLRCVDPSCYRIWTQDRDTFFTNLKFKSITECQECGKSTIVSTLFYNESIGYVAEYGQSYGYDLRLYPEAF